MHSARQGTQDLNASQRQAVEAMLSNELHLIWGPPGTGKTTTLGAAIAVLAHMEDEEVTVSRSRVAVARA